MSGLVVLKAVRWCAGLGVAVLASSAAPSVAMGDPIATYQYLTAYRGTYSFKSHFVYASNQADSLDTKESYEWVTYDYETVDLNSDHSYTRTLTHYIVARGFETGRRFTSAARRTAGRRTPATSSTGR